MDSTRKARMVRRLNVTLPAPLALYVGGVTGEGGLYGTPGGFIRDLIRRHMEQALAAERSDVRALLVQSLHENDYAPWSGEDLAEARRIASA